MNTGSLVRRGKTNSYFCQGRADITAQVGFLISSSLAKDICLTKTFCFLGGSLRAMPSSCLVFCK